MKFHKTNVHTLLFTQFSWTCHLAHTNTKRGHYTYFPPNEIINTHTHYIYVMKIWLVFRYNSTLSRVRNEFSRNHAEWRKHWNNHKNEMHNGLLQQQHQPRQRTSMLWDMRFSAFCIRSLQKLGLTINWSMWLIYSHFINEQTTHMYWICVECYKKRTWDMNKIENEIN